MIERLAQIVQRRRQAIEILDLGLTLAAFAVQRHFELEGMAVQTPVPAGGIAHGQEMGGFKMHRLEDFELGHFRPISLWVCSDRRHKGCFRQ